MSCPVCLSPATVSRPFIGRDFLFETTAKQFRFSGCKGCHCFFIDPLPTKAELANFYPPDYWWRSTASSMNRLESIYRGIALRDHIAFINKASQAMRRGGRVPRLLDVGCGSGKLLGLLRGRGFEVVGFETSEQAAALARDENGVEVICGQNLEDAGFSGSGFDIVTLFHVMEHISEPHKFLADVRRILHAAGRVVLQVPNIESWQFKLCGARWYGLDVPRHVINYSSRSIQRLLSDAGFRIRRLRHFNLRDNAPALASSLFPSLDPLSRGVRQRRRNKWESVPVIWLKHAAYAGVLAASFPFAIAESLYGCGATVMIEAEKA